MLQRFVNVIRGLAATRLYSMSIDCYCCAAEVRWARSAPGSFAAAKLDHWLKYADWLNGLARAVYQL